MYIYCQAQGPIQVSTQSQVRVKSGQVKTQLQLQELYSSKRANLKLADESEKMYSKLVSPSNLNHMNNAVNLKINHRVN